MTTKMNRLLAFSPHLDDAVFSAGARLGTLAATGTQVTVITVFAGLPTAPLSPAAQAMHKQWGLADDAAVRSRRDEDRQALACLRLRYAHWDFPDAIYRRRPDGSWLVREGCPPLHDGDCQEPDLLASLTAAATAAIDAIRPQFVLTCASFGNHIDHVLTRDAVLAATNCADVCLELWEDLPYALSSRRIPPLPDTMRTGARVAEIAAEVMWTRKYQAIDSYTSQQSILWPDQRLRRLRRHETALAGRNPAGRAEAFWPVGREG